jgi:hypothetical protein
MFGWRIKSSNQAHHFDEKLFCVQKNKKEKKETAESINIAKALVQRFSFLCCFSL